MRDTRSVLGIIGAGALVLGSVLVASPAQAAPAASPPGISPAAEEVVTLPPSGGTFQCAPGRLCLVVKDESTGNWKGFKLYQCHTYNLSHWNGDGIYFDNQTGNVTSYFYRQDWSEERHFTPDAPAQHAVNWSPIWHVKNC